MHKVPGLGHLGEQHDPDTLQSDSSHSLQAIATAIVEQDYETLTERSLGRIYQHFKASGTKSFAIMTSHRGDRPSHENKKSFLGLQRDVRSQGYGFTRMTGVGEEEGGMANKEPSLFVHGMSYKHAVEHGKKHGQHSIIYSGPETQGKVHLVHLKDDGDKKVGDHTDLGTFHPKKLGQYYSKVRNKDFTFGEEIKGFKYEAVNVGEAEVLTILIRELREAKR